MNLKIKKLLSGFLTLSLLGMIFLSPILVRAESCATAGTGEGGVDTTLCNPLPGIENLPDFVAAALKYALGLLGVIALCIFIYGGFTWMTSAGNEKKVTQGRDTIIWASLGILVIFLSYALVVTVFGLITAGTSGQQ